MAAARTRRLAADDTYNLDMPEIANPCREPLNRPLTQRERDLIRWLIEHSHVKDASGLLPQIGRLSVIARCICSCPTIDFAFRRGACFTKRQEVH